MDAGEKSRVDWELWVIVVVVVVYIAGSMIRAWSFWGEVDPDQCVSLIHSSPEVCVRIGGVIDVEGDGETVCVIRTKTPP